MSSLFKQRGVHYETPEGSTCRTKAEGFTVSANGRMVLRPGYRKVKTRSKNWYGQFKDADGRIRRVPLCPDKAAAKDILAKLVSDAARVKHGVVDRVTLSVAE